MGRLLVNGLLPRQVNTNSILKRAREVEQHDGPFPMRVNNQRLFQEFALQTPKLNGFTVQPRTQGEIPRPLGRKRTAKGGSGFRACPGVLIPFIMIKTG